jgi:hypothetical protein
MVAISLLRKESPRMGSAGRVGASVTGIDDEPAVMGSLGVVYSSSFRFHMGCTPSGGSIAGQQTSATHLSGCI